MRKKNGESSALPAIEWYEESDGSYGLRFPDGIDAKILCRLFSKAIAIIDREEKAKKKISRKTAQ